MNQGVAQPNANILELDGVKKYFPVRQGGPLARPTFLRAVDDVTLKVQKGESFGLVGESGCGKSTLSRTIMRLEEITAGEIRVDGQEIHAVRGKALRDLRRKVQMVFQNPFYSLNPRMRVGALVAEPLAIHRVGDRAWREKRVKELLDMVGLSAAAAQRYPHEFSGGQRQRVGIARALALNPQIVICDEPVSALDVSIQAQILNLLKALRDELGLTYVFISHNLSVVQYMSRRIAVMYLGTIVEIARAQTLYDASAHPYTQMLLSSVPDFDGRRKERIIPAADARGALGEGVGCPFAPRCPKSCPRCLRERPLLAPYAPEHLVACHFPEEGGTPRA